MTDKPDTGTLYIVSTPIGNLEDITLRALKVLGSVRIIAAEDTRHRQKLLHHYDIHTPQTSYHDHNKEEKSAILIAKLKEGLDIALVSDAGTPGISDPGYYLINRAIDENIKITPIPGPTASIAALSISGLPTDAFVFEGFLPAKKAARRKRLQELLSEMRTIIEGAHGEIITDTEDLKSYLEKLMKKEGLTLKDAVSKASKDMNLPKNKVYKEALKI